MTIELLPFSSFALESCGTTDVTVADGFTLTLRPTAPFSSQEPMDGTVVAVASSVEGVLRAAVVPVAGGALTLTL